jgi:hypothetical protein
VIRKIEPPLEKHEEADIIDLYQTCGCVVVSFAQPRHTMQSAGIPDLRIYCERMGWAVWFEVKRRKGPEYRKVKSEQSDDQKAFQALVESCGETYLIGSLEVAVEHLKRVGILT